MVLSNKDVFTYYPFPVNYLSCKAAKIPIVMFNAVITSAIATPTYIAKVSSKNLKQIFFFIEL